MLADKPSYDYHEITPKPAELVTLSTSVDDHAHDYLQLVFGIQGTAEFDINGRSRQMLPGQGCIITECCDHAFGSLHSPSDIFVLNLFSDSEPSQLVLHQLSELAQSGCYFQLNSQMRQLINMLASEIASHPDDLLLGQSCSNTIITLLNRHIQIFQSQSRLRRLDMDTIDRYISLHISRKINVAELAGSVFLSESQFHHLFKSHTGVTPHQYVLSKRIEHAKNLIEKHNYSLSHVAHLAGFSGHSTFTHAFSKQVGVSPSQYRKGYIS